MEKNSEFSTDYETSNFFDLYGDEALCNLCDEEFHPSDIEGMNGHLVEAHGIRVALS